MFLSDRGVMRLIEGVGRDRCGPFHKHRDVVRR